MKRFEYQISEFTYHRRNLYNPGWDSEPERDPATGRYRIYIDAGTVRFLWSFSPNIEHAINLMMNEIDRLGEVTWHVDDDLPA